MLTIRRSEPATCVFLTEQEKSEANRKINESQESRYTKSVKMWVLVKCQENKLYFDWHYIQ